VSVPADFRDLRVQSRRKGQKKAALKARPVNREETPRKGSDVSDAAQVGLYGASQQTASPLSALAPGKSIAIPRNPYITTEFHLLHSRNALLHRTKQPN
jgi:hypothetical protein